MQQAVIKRGGVCAIEAPAPANSCDSVLIKVTYSCISAGTEVSSVKSTSGGLIAKAIRQPERITKVLDLIKSQGIGSAIAKVNQKMDEERPIGYSISGIVVAVGSNVTEFKIGDNVAAAGAGIANHAEYVDIPRNLVVKVPSGVESSDASTVAIGSIAMQGVRRADLGLGEFAVVFGTGIIGLLTVQMLTASGVRVAAIDLDDRRLGIAADFGAELTINSRNLDPVTAIKNWTNGYGCDAVLFTAATDSSEALSICFKMSKRKGKVVLVGVSGMLINREDIYEKEIDFLISTSYGPGRYDKNYEQKGLEYPYGYVRWTENRNMAEYLRLIEAKKIALNKIIDSIFAIDKANEAFAALQEGTPRPLIVLLEYSKDSKYSRVAFVNHSQVAKSAISGVIRVGAIGMGSFATSVHLPILAKYPNLFKIQAIGDRKGHTASSISRMYNAAYATTDTEQVVNDPNVDLILISTRHDTHASLALKGLKAGKHVFVEKPLLTTEEELVEIVNFVKHQQKQPVLFVGFNRRFSPIITAIKTQVKKRTGSVLLNYRMNAGFFPKEHWIHEHGGRIVGEACHIIDLARYLIDSPVEEVLCSSLTPQKGVYMSSDNMSMTIKYQDGSMAIITYLSLGNTKLPKEYMEVHWDGMSVMMDDYKEVKGFGTNISVNTTGKGHSEEWQFLHKAISGNNGSSPISMEELLETSSIALAVSQGKCWNRSGFTELLNGSPE
jgi:predicted dehydrogenase/threonine dehydrogenase-like Zn-dependent dehydrogenase